MAEGNIIVRRYVDKDYTDLIEARYPFDSYLSPKLYNRLKNFANRKEIVKWTIKNFLLNQEEIVLVAYSKKGRKAVGVITLRKITDSLWGIWHVFVSPLSRGKRIASLLYKESFKLLRERAVKKVVAMVFLDNVASMKSIQRNWQGFLSTRIFACEKKSQMNENKFPNKIRIRKPHDERRNLFKTFRNCVGEQWCKVLEIGKNNFLDRIFGPAYIEPISKNFFTRSVMKKNVLIAEYKGKIEGYAISRARRLFPTYPVLHLFVPVSDNFDDVCRGLLIKAFNPSIYNKKRKFNFIYVGNVEAENRLMRLGFEVRQGVVAYKYL